MPLNLRKSMASAVALVAVVAGGAAIGNAATSPSTSTTTTTTTTASIPAHGSAAHENAETAVTGDAATKAQAAAVKAVGSGTAGAVTTDFNGGGYEVTVTKTDGSTVEIHLNNAFVVMQGKGGFGGPAHGSA